MERITLTDGSGAWFDADKAEKFDESSWWNGSNHISCPTGSQWHHQVLYRTKSGAYVLHCWSESESERDTYEKISEASAIKWLLENKHFDEVPDKTMTENEI